MGESGKQSVARVILPGLSTTIQDLGRLHQHDMGLSTGGACDPVAAILANRLVRNCDGASVLECCLTGPALEFTQTTTIAITGAPCGLLVDDEKADYNKPLDIMAGQRVTLGAMNIGMRSYLAVQGGWRGDQFLGSQSTQLPAGAGGYAGRILAADDELFGDARKTRNTAMTTAKHCDELARLVAGCLGTPKIIRVTPGPEFDDTPAAHPRSRISGPYRADNDISRMGIRLKASVGARDNEASYPSMTSGPVFPGTVQIPNDGHPIILACDCQAMGGYPRLLQVIQADLPMLGQIRPQDEIWFRLVTLSQARAILEQRQCQFPGVF